MEFARACEDLGFGAIAHELFLELDQDEGGSISYGEVTKLLQNRTFSGGRKCKQFLTSIAFERASTDGVGVHLNTSRWDLAATTEAELQGKLEEYLHSASARVSDLYACLTSDHSIILNKAAFVSAFARVGFSGPDGLIRRLFDDMDADDSGVVGVEELYAWMNGRMKRAQKSKDLTFALRDPTDPPLTELPWEADGVHCLQLELQKVLIRAELCPLDLLRGYDSDGGGTFTRKEFVVMMKRIVNDDDLWDEVLRDVVKSAFQTISGGDKSIDIVEFERFLNKGWLQLKASMISTSTAAHSTTDRTRSASSRAADAISTLSAVTSSRMSGVTCSTRTGAARTNAAANAGSWSEQDREYMAACILQRSARKRAFKKQAALVLAVEMTEAKAATIVQAHWRSLQAKRRVLVRRDELVRQRAIVRLQTAARVYLARKHRERLSQQMLHVQAATRGVGHAHSSTPIDCVPPKLPKVANAPASCRTRTKSAERLPQDSATIRLLQRKLDNLQGQLVTQQAKAHADVRRLEAQHKAQLERMRANHQVKQKEFETTLFSITNNSAYAVLARDKETITLRQALSEALHTNHKLSEELARLRSLPSTTTTAPKATSAEVVGAGNSVASPLMKRPSKSHPALLSAGGQQRRGGCGIPLDTRPATPSPFRGRTLAATAWSWTPGAHAKAATSGSAGLLVQL